MKSDRPLGFHGSPAAAHPPTRMSPSVTRGMDLAKSIKAATDLGCSVERLHRTGEFMFSHPSVEKRCRVDGHRKDTPWTLTTFLKKIEAQTPTPQKPASVPHSNGKIVAELVDDIARTKGYSLRDTLEKIGLEYPEYYRWKQGIGGPGDDAESRLLKSLDLLPDLRNPAPTVRTIKNKRETAEMAVLRRILRERFAQEGVSAYAFAKCLGKSASVEAVKRFVAGTGKRAVSRTFFEKMRSEARRREWLDVQTEEYVIEPEPDVVVPDDAASEPVDAAHQETQPAFTDAEIVEAVAKLWPNTALIKKLFPKTFPSLQ